MTAAPHARERSAGARITTSADDSTSPRALRGASARSTTRRFAGLSGGSANVSVPVIFS